MYCLAMVFLILEKDSKESKSIETNHKMKILTVVFMLLFTYLNSSGCNIMFYQHLMIFIIVLIKYYHAISHWQNIPVDSDNIYIYIFASFNNNYQLLERYLKNVLYVDASLFYLSHANKVHCQLLCFCLTYDLRQKSYTPQLHPAGV